MFLLLAATIFSADASDHGLVRVFDREVECAYDVDPKPDPETCLTRVRPTPPTDERPTWAISVAPPGKLFVSHHMPDVDWSRVGMVRTPRAFEPILLSVGLKEDPACSGERVGFAHLNSARGAVSYQACASTEWTGVGEVLLESHRRLPANTWVPVWGHHPVEPELAADVKNWFIVQVYISMDGSTPERPPAHPYASVSLLRGAIPVALPPRRAVTTPVP